VYWSVEGLWQDAVAKRPEDARTRVGYAEILMSADRLAEAEAHLRVAVEHARGRPLPFERLGAVLAQQDKVDAAIPYFERALAIQPENFYAHRFLADIFALRRQDALAAQHYERALARVPDDGGLTARLAAILADSSDPSVRDARRAVALAERAVRLTSGRDPRVLEILAAAQAASGWFADAASTARAALVLARAGGDRSLVSALEYRASIYDAAVRRSPGPPR
jgi:predicted Zn-dependent protease